MPLQQPHALAPLQQPAAPLQQTAYAAPFVPAPAAPLQQPHALAPLQQPAFAALADAAAQQQPAFAAPFVPAPAAQLPAFETQVPEPASLPDAAVPFEFVGRGMLETHYFEPCHRDLQNHASFILCVLF